MTLDELKKKVEIDLELTPDNVSQKSLNYSSMYHFYISYYHKSLVKYNKLKIKRDEVYGKLYHAYKFENKAGGFDVGGTKSEMECYIKSDPDYINIATEFSQQECLVKYLELVLDDVKSLSFTLKNYIDFEKMRLGV